MSLPITPTYIGQSPNFMRRMTSMAEALPAMFARIDSLGLKKSYVGLKGIRFVENFERGSSTMSRYDRSTDIISIYPMAFRGGSRIDVTFYTGLGLRHWELNIPTNLMMVWKHKLIQPNMATMDRLTKYLRGGISSYKELIDKFQTPIDKLQVIHVVNALIDNSVKPQEAKTLDLFGYPPVEDFCKGLTPYSLVPLLSAYRGGIGTDIEKYENAFAEFCCENGKVRAAETSVEFELSELFRYCSGLN